MISTLLSTFLTTVFGVIFVFAAAGFMLFLLVLGFDLLLSAIHNENFMDF